MTDNDKDPGAAETLMRAMLDNGDFTPRSVRALMRLLKPLSDESAQAAVPHDWPKPSDDKAAPAATAQAVTSSNDALDAQFRMGAHDHGRERRVVNEGALQKFGV